MKRFLRILCVGHHEYYIKIPIGGVTTAAKYERIIYWSEADQKMDC